MRNESFDVPVTVETDRQLAVTDTVQAAEMLIEAFDESTSSSFDPATGEIVFAYEYATLDDEDEDEDETDDEADEEEDEDAEVADEDEVDEDEEEKARA